MPRSFRRTNAADNRAPAINADPDPKRRFIGAHQIGIEKFETAQHRTSSRYGIVGMRRRGGAGTEDCHETVAQEFVDHAAVLESEPLRLNNAAPRWPRSRDPDPLIARAGVGYGLDYAHVTEAIFEGWVWSLSTA